MLHLKEEVQNLQPPAQMWSDSRFKGRLSTETTEMEKVLDFGDLGVDAHSSDAASTPSQKFIWTQLVFQGDLQSVWSAH